MSLMTLHSAKGLEFKNVFIAGFVDGLMPLLRYERQLHTLTKEQLTYPPGILYQSCQLIDWLRWRPLLGGAL